MKEVLSKVMIAVFGGAMNLRLIQHTDDQSTELLGSEPSEHLCEHPQKDAEKEHIV